MSKVKDVVRNGDPNTTYPGIKENNINNKKYFTAWKIL
jgi:hypothetical protein